MIILAPLSPVYVPAEEKADIQGTVFYVHVIIEEDGILQYNYEPIIIVIL